MIETLPFSSLVFLWAIPWTWSLHDPYEEHAPFHCPGQGYYGDPDDCSIYYLCLPGSQQLMDCPAGTRWDQKNQMCNWARDVPCRARLRAKDITVGADGKVTCLDDKEGELPDPADCSAYYVCVAGGRGGRFQCPAKLWYDPVKHECEYKDKVDCPLFRTSPPPPTTPEPTIAIPTEFRCPPTGKLFVRDIFDCSAYHFCDEGVDERFDCPGGFHYDVKEAKCDWPNKETCQPRCPNRSGRVTPIYITDEFHCATYYRCQNDGTPVPYICPYPKLWDVVRKECRDYGEVECGVRKEAKLPCDYDSTRRCLMVPNCGGKANGVYPDDKRDCKWYYKCQDERTTMHLMCPKNHIYSYPDEKCVPTSSNKPCVYTTIAPSTTSTTRKTTTGANDEETSSEGRDETTENDSDYISVDPRFRCLEKDDGLYPDIASGCRKFFRCQAHMVIRSGRCRQGNVLNTFTKSCDDPIRLPPPCGTNNLALFQWGMQHHSRLNSASSLSKDILTHFAFYIFLFFLYVNVLKLQV